MIAARVVDDTNESSAWTANANPRTPGSVMVLYLKVEDTDVISPLKSNDSLIVVSEFTFIELLNGKPVLTDSSLSWFTPSTTVLADNNNGVNLFIILSTSVIWALVNRFSESANWRTILFLIWAYTLYEVLDKLFNIARLLICLTSALAIAVAPMLAVV